MWLSALRCDLKFTNQLSQLGRSLEHKQGGRNVGFAIARLVAAFVVVGVTIASSAGAAPSGSATFTDPAGDAQGGPDITRVAVSGDAATGLLTLTVTASGYAAAVSGGLERDISVWLDTDRNSSTGDPDDGSEYGLLAWNDASGRWWNIVRWDGAAWKSVPESATMRVTGQGESMTWALSTADLAGATGFRFYVVAGNWNTTSARYDTRDEAPNTGWWDFDISAPSQPPSTPPPAKVGLLVDSPSATPSPPRAGKQLSLRFPVQIQTTTKTLIDLGGGNTREALVIEVEPAQSGTFTATISVAGDVVKRSGSVRRGALRLSLAVPKTATGKLVRIVVKVTATDKETGKSLKAAKVVTYRVK
jgi:hypothetical protein